MVPAADRRGPLGTPDLFGRAAGEELRVRRAARSRLKEAEEEHARRLEKIKEQSALHMADTKRRRAENLARKKKLQEDHLEQLAAVELAIQKAAAEDPQAAAAARATPLQEVPVCTQVVTPQQFKAGVICKKMLAKPGLEGLTDMQAKAMELFFFEALNEAAVTATVAPLPAQLHMQQPPVLPAGSGDGGAEPAAVQGGGETAEQRKQDVQMRTEEEENKRLADEMNGLVESDAARQRKA